MEIQALLADFTDRDWQTLDDGGPVRFAMIGLGWWTREEAIPAIKGSDFCTTTVVVSGSEEKAREVARENESVQHGITYDQFHGGVATDAYDAVYICTPNATHTEYVETAAELGKDVLCEKPMAATSAGAREIVETCDNVGITLMIAYRMQTEPAVRRARDVIDAGVIGDPIQVHGHMSDCVPNLIPDPDQWRLDPELSGGATLIDIGLYPLNTTRFLLNCDPMGVYAHEFSEHQWFESLDEHVSFQVEFEGNVSAVCTVSHNAYNASHLRVLGSDGEVTIEPAFFPGDDRELTVRHGDSTGSIRFEQRNQMTEEFDYFAHCLLTGTEPVPDGQHGLLDIEVVEAMYESADQGKRIQLQ
jgi:xylose dehydrogenase (NAD/NADP)